MVWEVFAVFTSFSSVLHLFLKIFWIYSVSDFWVRSGKLVLFLRVLRLSLACFAKIVQIVALIKPEYYFGFRDCHLQKALIYL